MRNLFKRSAGEEEVQPIEETVRAGGLKHIAFIMDGNGRWAKKRGLPREAGHREGAKVFREITEYCADIGIENVTVYALSTENLKNRPEHELDALMGLFGDYFMKAMDSEKAKKTNISFLGDRGPLPENIRNMMDTLEKRRTEGGKSLYIAVNYGGRDELVRAVNKLIADGKSTVTEEDISANIDAPDCPLPDMIVRTGGESRISNFLMWESAYSELNFFDKLWPDYSKADVDEAVRWFAGRKRRFGGV